MKIIIEHNGTLYNFNQGLQAYIFDKAVINKIIEDELLYFVSFVEDLYHKDMRPTPLGDLIDYVASYWNDLKDSNKSRKMILDDFYEKIDFDV